MLPSLPGVLRSRLAGRHLAAICPRQVGLEMVAAEYPQGVGEIAEANRSAACLPASRESVQQVGVWATRCRPQTTERVSGNEDRNRCGNAISGRAILRFLEALAKLVTRNSLAARVRHEIGENPVQTANGVEILVACGSLSRRAIHARAIKACESSGRHEQSEPRDRQIRQRQPGIARSFALE